MNHEPAYGLWSLVLMNSAVFILFAFSFFKPQTQPSENTVSPRVVRTPVCGTRSMVRSC